MLLTIVHKAYHINPKIKFEVFIHKVDGLSDDAKIGTDLFGIKSLPLIILQKHNGISNKEQRTN